MATHAQESSSAEEPAIVIVQGSFQIPLVHEALGNGLRSRGYPVVHPTLPSCSNTDSPEFPSIILADDALAVQRDVTRLIEEGKMVVLVMHSYGGLVGSEAIPEDLIYSIRQTRAFLIEAGKSVLDAFGESPNNDVEPDGRFFMKNGAQLIYNDLPSPEPADWGSKMIPQSYIPSTYLICDGDQAVPPQYQEMFAAMANSHVERCSSGHAPMLSQTEMLVGKIVEAAEKTVQEAKT